MAIIWKHRIASIAQKIFLRQNTFFDDSDGSSNESDYMKAGLNSEFAEFLLHFPSEAIPAYEVSWVFYKTFTGLSNTIALFMRFEFFNAF